MKTPCTVGKNVLTFITSKLERPSGQFFGKKFANLGSSWIQLVIQTLGFAISACIYDAFKRCKNFHVLFCYLVADAINFSSFCRYLAATLNMANDDHVPVLITRQNGKPAVLMSLEDFRFYEETAYLMASPNNAMRLNQAIVEIEAAFAVGQKLLEE